MEKLDNPPALLRPTEVSPGTVSTFGPFTSYQVNVDANGNNIVGDAANEPCICVDPTNRNRLAVGWRQFDNVSSNFRQAGYGYSSNGGITWTSAGPLQSGVFRSDPVLDADAGGNFFYLSLLNNFFDDLWNSISGGQNWTRIGPADGGDKQWFVIDTTNSSGHGFMYQAWSDEPSGNNYSPDQFTRSTDGGVSWINPIQIPHTPRWGTLDIDSNGTFFLAGVNYASGQIWCVRSSNAKNGAMVPAFDQSTRVNLGGSITVSQPINPDGLVGQVYVAVDRSGGATNNNVYMLASVVPSSGNGSNVMFARSTDSGATFSAPKQINDDNGSVGTWHWFGAMSVAPNGRIDVVWLDSRNAAGAYNSQLFYSSSLDGGITWSANVPVSAAFDPRIGYPNQNKIGDYLSIVSGNDAADVAYAATFNGEQDVYAVRVSPSAVTTITIAASANPSSGGTVSGQGHYAAGSTVTLTATAASCNTFTNWTDNGQVVSTSATYQFTASSNRTLTANFSAASYNITVNTTTGGSVSGGGTFNCGSTVTVTATPDSGFGFSNWTENGSVVSTAATYTFTASADRNLTAHFGNAVIAPVISPAGGTFKRKVKVTMTCATTGATIHYTTDGSDPTGSSPIYPTPTGKKKQNKGIKISGTGMHTIKAIGTMSGSGQSPITTAVFTIN